MKAITPERQQILDLLADGLPHTPSDIADRLNKKRSNINRLMLALAERGLVSQPSYGVYTLPAQQPSAHNPAMGVYVLRSGPFYKIGRSTNVSTRVRQLQTALPQETIHIHTILTDRPDDLERKLHQKFASKRIRGEWFELDTFDVDDLCSMGAEHS